MEIVEWLTSWYKSNCDGDWEHSYGVRIDTLDNPGWSINIDLVDTNEEGKMISIKIENSDEDWYSVISDGNIFTAYGDFNKLPFLISKFKEFVETSVS